MKIIAFDKMKLIVIILILATSLFSFSQDLKKIESEEILFIYFDKEDNLLVTKNVKKYDSLMKPIYYNYSFPKIKKDSCDYSQSNFYLRYSRYDDFDKMFDSIPSISFKIHKSFLKQNSDMLLNNKFIRNLGFNKISNLFRKAKMIFLIDEEDINGNEITVKQVKYSYIGIE